MKNTFAFVALATLLASCSSTSEEDGGSVEAYSCYDCLSTENAATTDPNVWFKIPDAVLEIFKPTLEEGISDLYKDTLDFKTTVTDYRLVLRKSSAELEVKTNAKMKARVLQGKKCWYVFKAGVYQVNDVDKYEVRQDGIYLVGSGEKWVSLNDFRYLDYPSDAVISSEDFIRRYTTILKGSASADVFFVSKADTTYKCSRISDKEIQLDMISPKTEDCTILDKE